MRHARGQMSDTSHSELAKHLVHRIFERLMDAEDIRIARHPTDLVGHRDSVPICVQLPNLYWTIRILLRPDLMLGQCYVDGRWQVPPERLFDFLRLILSQRSSLLQKWYLLSTRFHLLRDTLQQRLLPIRSTRAVVEHYNTDATFMRFVLGPSLSYTCAFFDDESASLDEAQASKLRKIVARAMIRSGHRVLDLGTGWGYAPFPLAEEYGCEVTGITISSAQVEFCNQRKQASSRAGQLNFVCADYLHYEPAVQFDRVISVGMLEHVGKFQYKDFFNRVAHFLLKGGVALVHSMIQERETSPDAWIDRNIFPGGYIPTVSEVVAGIQKSNCELIQVFTQPKWYYFRTLELWKRNLFERRLQCEGRLAHIGLLPADVKKVMRLWEYFLSSSQIAFSEFGHLRTAHFLVRPKH
jgi:cyclopropane-fatty-acyl-phospholipid synthase